MIDQRLQSYKEGDQEASWAAEPHADEWLTPQEIAKELKVNQQTVRNWLRDGLLAGAKFGDVWRVRRPAYDAFVAEAVRRGQRYEMTDELKALLDEYDYQQMQAFGGGEQVDLIVDLDPTDRSRNEIRLTSRAIKGSVENAEQGAYECAAHVEDSEEQPYEALIVHGKSHSDAFMRILSAIHDYESRAR